MSLDQFVKKTITSRTVCDVPIVLPPEYDIDPDTWRELIQAFNHTSRKAKLAAMVEQYIRENNPTRKNYDTIFSITQIVEKNGRYVTDLIFEGDKAGLTALVVYTAEELHPTFVTSPKGDGGIRHVVLTYIPEK